MQSSFGFIRFEGGNIHKAWLLGSEISLVFVVVMCILITVTVAGILWVTN